LAEVLKTNDDFVVTIKIVKELLLGWIILTIGTNLVFKRK